MKEERAMSSRPSPAPRATFRGLDAASIAVLVATVALSLAVYPRLPPRIAIHFDIHGVADGYASRAFGVAILPAVSVFTWAMVRGIARFMRGERRARLEASPTEAVGFLTVSFMSSMQLIVLWMALSQARSMGVPFCAAFGLFWIALGQLMPRTRRNPIMGVRTGWTLASDENWARTHRMAGIAMTVGGVVALLSAAANLPTVGISAAIVSSLWPIVWSWIVARRLPRDR
jgi:uncharacterized membrane protein